MTSIDVLTARNHEFTPGLHQPGRVTPATLKTLAMLGKVGQANRGGPRGRPHDCLRARYAALAAAYVPSSSGSSYHERRSALTK